MNAGQRHAFDAAVRACVEPTIDQLVGQVAALAHQVEQLERLVLPPEPKGRRQRRKTAAALRGEGHSVRAISELVGASRNTVAADLRAVGAVPPDGRVIGRDGRLTAPRLAQ